MGPEKTSGHPNIWDVWNAHNPDTIAKFANYGNSYDFMELLSGTEIHNPGKIMEDEKRWQEWRKEMKEDSEQK